MTNGFIFIPLKDQFCGLLLNLRHCWEGQSSLFDITTKQKSLMGRKLAPNCAKLARISFHCMPDLSCLSPGVSMHSSSGLPSTPASVNGARSLSLAAFLVCIEQKKNKQKLTPCAPPRCTDSLRKKLSAIPSPEREISTVSLKKDVKYGLGESTLAVGKSQSPPLTYISSWNFGVC